MGWIRKFPFSKRKERERVFLFNEFFLSHSRKIKLPSAFHIQTITRNVLIRMKNISTTRATIFFSQSREGTFTFTRIILERFLPYLNFASSFSRHTRCLPLRLFMLKSRYNFRFLFYFEEKWGFIVSSWLGMACKKFPSFDFLFFSPFFQFHPQDSPTLPKKLLSTLFICECEEEKFSFYFAIFQRNIS